MQKKINIFLCLASTIFLILIDQFTKKIAEKYLQDKNEAVEVLGNYIILLYTKNRGGFLSIGSKSSNIIWVSLFVIIPIIALIVLSVYIIINKQNQPIYLFFLTLILSGGIGNIIDRIKYGKVTDFMNIGIGSIRSGIFNFADLYIVFLTIMLILYYLINKYKFLN